jgi:hypothetical protein
MREGDWVAHLLTRRRRLSSEERSTGVVAVGVGVKEERRQWAEAVGRGEDAAEVDGASAMAVVGRGRWGRAGIRCHGASSRALCR